jgi:hypothetical protein
MPDRMTKGTDFSITLSASCLKPYIAGIYPNNFKSILIDPILGYSRSQSAAPAKDQCGLLRMAFNRLAPLLDHPIFVIAADQFMPKCPGGFRAFGLIDEAHIMAMDI